MFKKRTIFKVGFIALALLLVFTILPATAASTINPIPAGRTVEMLVPFGPGGAFDTTNRLVAPFLEAELTRLTGVQQTVIVVNLPGASGRICYEEITRDPANSPRFAIMSSSALPQQVGTATGYDVTKFTYLGRASADYRGIFVDINSDMNTFQDIVARSKTRPFLIGTSGYGSSEQQNALMLMKVLKDEADIDLSIEFVHFSGVGEIHAALLRGDIEGGINTTTDVTTMINNNAAKMVVMFAAERQKGFEDVPTLAEAGVAEDVALRASNAVAMQKRSFIASPQMNPALAELFITALYNVLHSPELIAQATEMGLEIEYVSPQDDLQDSIDTMELMEEFKTELIEMYM